MAIAIRDERAGDAAAIRAVLEAAFGQGEEAALVDALRASGAATWSLVATAGGEGAGAGDGASEVVVGHVLFSPVAIDTPAGRRHAVGLAPLAVAPAAQRRGVGRALVEAGLARLRAAGHGAVIVLGDPAYYGRLGFVDARRFGLAWEVPGHEAAFQALELEPGALAGAAGTVRYRPEVMGHRVRLARGDELGALQALERAAAERFRASTHPHAAELPPLAVEELAGLRAEGGLWVIETDGALAAFVALTRLDRDGAGAGDLYVVELDVAPAHAGARLGAALLDHAGLVAARRGLARLVLRTFADVPWNAPYYRRLGFVDVPVAALSPGLVAMVGREAAAGLDVERRVTLARAIAPPRRA